jgi:hypothetical protein
MTTSTPPRPLGRNTVNRLVGMLVDGERTPAEISEETGLPLTRLSTFGHDDRANTLLAGLSRIADVRAQMILSNYRAHAVLKLIALASTEKPSETSRKACVDLLKADLDVFAKRAGDTPAPADEPPKMSEEAILAALEQLGEDEA